MEMIKKVGMKIIMRYHFLVLNSSSMSDEQRKKVGSLRAILKPLSFVE